MISWIPESLPIKRPEGEVKPPLHFVFADLQLARFSYKFPGTLLCDMRLHLLRGGILESKSGLTNRRTQKILKGFTILNPLLGV